MLFPYVPFGSFLKPAIRWTLDQSVEVLVTIDRTRTCEEAWFFFAARLLAEWFTGWWFGCHFLFSHILGMSSSQLTFIFFRGVAQPPTSLFHRKSHLQMDGDWGYPYDLGNNQPWDSAMKIWVNFILCHHLSPMKNGDSGFYLEMQQCFKDHRISSRTLIGN